VPEIEVERVKVIQMLPTFMFGDAIGNEALEIDRILKDAGYETTIYAENISDSIPKNIVHDIRQGFEEPDRDDVILYHMSIAWAYFPCIQRAQCRKIALYHNVTPASFFKEYHKDFYDGCMSGLNEVKRLKNEFDYCLADSEFNRQDLISYGYSCPIDVLPLIIPFEDYRKKPDSRVIRKYSSPNPCAKGSNVAFVGRIVPNKKFEDIIAAFTLYQRNYDQDAKLFLVGNYGKDDVYYRRLRDYVQELGVKNVFFTGHISFAEILAYYRIADVFVCMSEHEGFCVPIVESMLFKTPIIAFDAGAVADTLGGGGILLKEKDPLLTAGLIDRVVRDGELREEILKGQRRQLSRFRFERIRDLFLRYLSAFCGREG
jgi:glycosyltransferase involved in cell wall biosynthesis